MKNILSITFLLIVYSGEAQTVEYEITSTNTTLGNLSVTKTQHANTTEIEVMSDVKVKLFISIDLKYKLNSTYRNNQLLFSSVTTYVNGKIHSTSKTEKITDGYLIVKDGHTSKFMEKIDFFGALLYFNEPKNISNIFSEFDNFKKSLQPIGDHTYQIINPKNSQKSEYIYQNGILQKATIHHTLMTFHLTKTS